MKGRSNPSNWATNTLQRPSMATFRRNVASLQTIAMNRIVQSLGERAKSVARVFCCGNTLSSPERVRPVYENSGSNWSSVTFPGTEQTAVQQLLGACAVGIGGEEATDKSYCDALTLDPDRFLTSFQLSHTPILDDIRKLLLPDARGSVRAELRKLSVYAPGGRLKARVDTPRSSQVFGSLIVCLPTQFMGGTLFLRHLGKERRWDWPQNSTRKVSWAAFSSNVEYEVLPVTQGYHLTLTYSLYTVVNQQGMTSALISSPAFTNSLFCRELYAAVSNPHFLRDGGVLGFRCQKEYTPQDLNQTEDLPHLLKGADNIVYEAGKLLGLPVIVKPVASYLLQDNGRVILPTFSTDSSNRRKSIRTLPASKTTRRVTYMLGRVHDDKHITWCQKLNNLRPAGYLPRPERRARDFFIVYQVACILVGVPSWSKRQFLAAESQQSMSEEAIKPCRKEKKCIETEFGGPEMEELLDGPDWKELQ